MNSDDSLSKLEKLTTLINNLFEEMSTAQLAGNATRADEIQQKLRDALAQAHQEVAAWTRSQEPPGSKYPVFVDSNYHYMNEDERYVLGEFNSEAEAIQAARKIVDDFLTEGYKPGMSAEDLMDTYKSFGDDPWIRGSSFSAWRYAEQRCQELCNSG